MSKANCGKGRRLSRIRNACIMAVVIAFGIGLAIHTGWGNLSSMGFESVAYICPLGALETLFSARSGIPRVYFTLIAVVAIVLVAGKAFCAWVCPVSLFGNGKKEPAVKNDGENHARPEDCLAKPDGGKRDGIHLDSRHVVLTGTLVSASIFGFPVFCLICPIGLFFGTIVVVWRAFGFAEVSWSLVVFPALLILEMVVFRKWCHKICPLGALLSLISIGNKTLKPHVDEKKCLREKGDGCRICAEGCPELLDPHSSMIPECSKCGHCVENCPASAIKMCFLPKP